jgi:hypothetical protein
LQQGRRTGQEDESMQDPDSRDPAERAAAERVLDLEARQDAELAELLEDEQAQRRDAEIAAVGQPDGGIRMTMRSEMARAAAQDSLERCDAATDPLQKLGFLIMSTVENSSALVLEELEELRGLVAPLDSQADRFNALGRVIEGATVTDLAELADCLDSRAGELRANEKEPECS